MDLNSTTPEPSLPPHRKRGGRPSAEQAGEVDRRILDAATTLFLRSGFDATSCDQVLALAGAGKATLYARYANKDALFSAVVRRMVEQTTLPALDLRQDMPPSERLRAVGNSLLDRVVTAESVALLRVCVAAAHRLPELSQLVGRMGRDSGVASIVLALAGPVPSPDKAKLAVSVAERFIEMVIIPQQMRSLVGDDHERLNDAAPGRINDAIDLFARAGLLEAFESAGDGQMQASDM